MEKFVKFSIILLRLWLSVFFFNENKTMQFIYNIDLNVQRAKEREEKGIKHRSGTIFEAKIYQTKSFPQKYQNH